MCPPFKFDMFLELQGVEKSVISGVVIHTVCGERYSDCWFWYFHDNKKKYTI